ncbi:MAG TPA: hypothetical protein VKA27_06510, partial [Sunxiuqinia sp.]|nr:hypothetical protein [Sunxiuqinia sp.]
MPLNQINECSCHVFFVEKKRHRRSIEITRRLSLAFLLLFAAHALTFAQTDDDCLACHNDPELYTVVKGKMVSQYIKPDALKGSVHEGIDCASCHADAAVVEWPHPEKLQPVDCSMCHDQEMADYLKGVHGSAYSTNDKNAPTCKDCHGTHQILRASDPKAATYKMNIPVLCGKCHQEGAPVARNYNISEHNIIENYSQGIHGKGLFKQGLTVTATCNNCHGNHLILPHT